MQVIFAGPRAEAGFLGKPVGLLMSDFLLLEELTKASGQDQADIVAAECGKLACLIVKQHWSQIEAVAKALIAREYLTGDEVAEIIDKTSLG